MSARTILKHVYENGGMTEYQYERIDRVLKERERPHGEWKQVTAKDGEYYFYHQCTNCGQTIESGFDNPPLFNFCPNCGADMRGERNESNCC